VLCHIVNALHHSGILDAISKMLVVGTPGQLDVAAPLEAGTIAWLEVAEIAPALIVPTRGELFFVAPSTRFLSSLAKEMMEPGFCGDAKAIQAAVSSMRTGSTLAAKAFIASI
jgi:hypothetical protein